ncbi:MAG: hypothetical protein JXR73_05515 [Candidatus Omnitrophica bacterium]|nr:hypothetical protein [Candidatus Omnitrophota bacterium]
MIKHFFPIIMSIIIYGYAITCYAGEFVYRSEFSSSTIEDNHVDIQGADFGKIPQADISFGGIPIKGGIKESEDGLGMIIDALPGEGVMIFSNPIDNQYPAMIRCTIYSENPQVSVTVAAIDLTSNTFVSTNGPVNGAYFHNQYQRASTFFVPSSSLFQPLIQIINQSETEKFKIFLDDFEVYSLHEDDYYNEDFLDNDSSDPDAAMTVLHPSMVDLQSSFESIPNDPLRIDFSHSTAMENGVILQGADFGKLPMADISFSSIPVNNAFPGATDGNGAVITAEPGEGAMIMSESILSSYAAMIRCHVRSDNPHAIVTLAAIDQSTNLFVSTNGPQHGDFFVDRYQRLTNFFVPPSTGFIPLIQVFNAGQTDMTTVYIDNFEVYFFLPDVFYSGELLDGDQVDPEIIGVRPIDVFTPTPSEPDVFTFDGGTWDELKSMNPSLHFEQLIIDGTLDLPLSSSAAMTVNQLIITPNGKIRAPWSECQYQSAPTLSIFSSGDVVIEGEIQLNGRSGTRVTLSPECKSCAGQAGGKLFIIAQTILIEGSIQCNGGSGGVSSLGSLGSIPCAGAQGGEIHFEAPSIILDGATVESTGGNGGIGYSDGNEKHGADGAPGIIDFDSNGFVQIENASVKTDGTLFLRAQQTSIYSKFEKNELNASINGIADNQIPFVEILYPQSNSNVRVDEPFLIRIRSFDAGAGISDIHISGMGINIEASVDGFVDGEKEFILPPPSPIGDSITVTVWDNNGLSNSQTVFGLKLSGMRYIDKDETYPISTSLDFGDLALMVDGSLLVRRSQQAYTIQCATFVMSESSSIQVDDADAKREDVPSLSIVSSNAIQIDGIVDLSGRRGTGPLGRHGENGGDFTLQSPWIDIGTSATIHTDGGDGRRYTENLFSTSADGGDAGNITMIADQLSLSGRFSAVGGKADNGSIGGCAEAGEGGDINITYEYGDSFHSRFFLTGGEATQSFACNNPSPGMDGRLLGVYVGPKQSDYWVSGAEIEPNNVLGEEQFLLPPFKINGRISTQDQGDFLVGAEDDIHDDLEDLYRISITNPMDILVYVAYESQTADLDFHLIRLSDLSVWSSQSRDIGETEGFQIFETDLTPGEYILAISAWEGLPTENEISYSLFALPGRF